MSVGGSGGAATPIAGTPVTAIPASSVTPILVSGGGGTNATCSDLAATHAPGAEWIEVKLNQAPNGSHTVADTMITANITNGSKLVFDWTSNIAVDAVFVKSGVDGHNLYLYPNESTGAANLTTPTGQDISHVSFCYDVELVVARTAVTTFKRDYDWTIAKAVDQAAVTVAAGGQTTVNYTVVANKDNGTDSEWAVAGTVTVTNPHKTLAASAVDVTDVLSDHGPIAVSCPSAALAPLASMTCTYGTTAVASGIARTGTATGDSGTFGIVAGRGTTPVAFSTPTTVLDNAISVTDSYAGAGVLGTNITASRTFTYARTIQASQLACGANTVSNTASLATDDGITRTATANVTATLSCGSAAPPPVVTPPVVPPVVPGPAVSACTYSQGYWGSHTSASKHYNATWATLENTTFYLSGMTYGRMMDIPSKGNAYNILGVQYIAAKLNMLKGAPAPAGVDLAAIDTFYKTYTPAQIDALKGNDNLRKTALAWADILDQYNNGKLNAPHCG